MARQTDMLPQQRRATVQVTPVINYMVNFSVKFAVIAVKLSRYVSKVVSIYCITLYLIAPNAYGKISCIFFGATFWYALYNVGAVIWQCL